MRITFIRHAITAWNAAGRWQGQSDTPLSDAGIAQATLLRTRLERTSHHFNAVYSSPLERAIHTAQIVLPNTKITLDDRLLELDFGDFEGKTYPENSQHPHFQDWLNDPYHVATPNGESLEHLTHRMQDFVQSLEPDTQTEKHYLIFSHSCAIRALISASMGLPMRINDGNHFPFVIQVPHTSLSRLRFCHGIWSLEQLGDVGHL
jgi:broad specificity phosphatase PhoE